MRNTKILVFLLIGLLLISFVSARSWYLIRTPERMRNIYFDPVNTKLTSNEAYTKPITGYGLKDISNSPRGSGFKGAEDVASNLPYNAFIPRGRDPSHISNWDPKIRGYSIMNEYVELFAVENPVIQKQGEIRFPGTPAGSARIVSNRKKAGDQYETTITLRLRDVVGLNQPYELFEAWLVDAETTYPLSIGMMPPKNYNAMSTLTFEFDHYVHNYDFIMITKEPYPDPDPNPGEVVMMGEIPHVKLATLPVSELSYLTK